MTRTVAMFVFDDVEVLDFSGPFEVFSVASCLDLRDQLPAPFSVVTVSRDAGPITARGGYRFLPSHAFADAPAADVLIVPGGVVEAERARPDVIAWIRRASAQAELTAAVCTGAFLLAEAGILDGLTATTHWEDIADLRRLYPAVQVVDDRQWVDEGRVVTSAGISAGIDMSLHLVSRLAGADLARRTARQMEYRWPA